MDDATEGCLGMLLIPILFLMFAGLVGLFFGIVGLVAKWVIGL